MQVFDFKNMSLEPIIDFEEHKSISGGGYLYDYFIGEVIGFCIKDGPKILWHLSKVSASHEIAAQKRGILRYAPM